MINIIFKLFILFLILSFIFNKLTKNYLNPYKLIMVFGKKGSGKTTYLTKQAINHIKQGWSVYSNIYIPNTYQFDINDIGYYQFPEKSLIIIDEVGMIWDNRNFKNFKTDVRDYFKLQRQYKHKVIMTSQAFDIDKKLRDLTDDMYLLTNFMRLFSICRHINKKIVISNNENGGGENGGTLSEFYSFSFPPSITFIPRWTDFFQSFNPKPLSFKSYNFNDISSHELKLYSFKYWLIYHFKRISKLKIIKLKGLILKFFQNIKLKFKQLIKKFRSIKEKLFKN